MPDPAIRQSMDLLEPALALWTSLGTALGVELEPDAEGACGLRIDDQLDVTLRYEATPPGLLVYCMVGTLPEARIEGALRRLLEANHVWNGTRGATWSLSGSTVVLSRIFPLQGIEADGLAAELAVFVQVAFEELETLSASSVSPPGLTERLPGGMLAV